VTELDNITYSATSVMPIRQLADAFIRFYADEIVHPTKQGREQRRANRTVTAARKSVHVFASLLEQQQLRVDQLPGDFLKNHWLPSAAVYSSSGTARVNPVELNKRAGAVNSFISWLKSKGFPVSHIEPLELHFASQLNEKEQVMSQDPQFGETPALPPAAPPPPPAPAPVPQPQQWAPPPQQQYTPPPQASYAPPPGAYFPPPAYAPPPAAPQPPPAPRAPAAPAAPRATASSNAVLQFFPAETERVRVWVVKPDRTNTGMTSRYVNEASAEEVIDAQGVEPFLLKKFVPQVIETLPAGTDEATFEVQAYTKAGAMLSKRVSYTIAIPAGMIVKAQDGAQPRPGALTATFMIDGRRYFLGPDGRPVALDAPPPQAPAPAPAPVPAPAAPADPMAGLAHMFEGVMNRLDARLTQLADQVQDIRRGPSNNGGLGGLDFGEAPKPVEAPNPLAVLETVERIMDKRMAGVAAAAPVTQQPMEQFKNMIELMGSVMQLTSPKQVNVDTQNLEDRMKQIDAKIDARLGNRDPLRDVATTMNTVRSIFGISGNPLNPAPPAQKSIAEVIGEVFTTALSRLPETVDALDKLAGTAARARATGMQAAADNLRATRPPVSLPAPQQRPRPAPAAAPAAAPRTPPAPVVQKPKAASPTPLPPPVVTTADAAYRTPGMGNELQEEFHQHIFKVLSEADRNLRLAAWMDLFAAFSKNEELRPISANVETILQQHRYGRLVELLTQLFNKFGYENVTLGYTLGLTQDFVRYAIEQKFIDPRFAGDFLAETVDDREKDIASRAEEANRRAARKAREEPEASTDEEGDEEGEEQEEEEDEGEMPAMGGELTVVMGGASDDEEQDEEPDAPEEPEQEEEQEESEADEEQDAPEATEEAEEPEAEDVPEAKAEDAEDVPEAEEPPKAPRKSRKAKKAEKAAKDDDSLAELS